MINDASKRPETLDEGLVSERMINTKAVHRRAPSPFLLAAMLCPPQINKASLRMESFKKIGAVEACAGPLDSRSFWSECLS
jgi:hypothetical protein